jgi:hypothetical protein
MGGSSACNSNFCLWGISLLRTVKPGDCGAVVVCINPLVRSAELAAAKLWVVPDRVDCFLQHVQVDAVYSFALNVVVVVVIVIAFLISCL